MDLATLFSADGRIGRLTWLRLNLLFGLFGFLAAALITSGNGSVGAVGLVLTAFLIAAAIVGAIKRSHDHGWSWFWLVFMLIPLIGFVWFWLMPGQRGANRYGDPESGSPFGRRSGTPAKFHKVTP